MFVSHLALVTLQSDHMWLTIALSCILAALEQRVVVGRALGSGREATKTHD